MPPTTLEWQTEHRVEQLNREVYGEAWAWLPLPVWLTLVDPASDGRELERLALAWGSRAPHAAHKPDPRRPPRPARRPLPLLPTRR